MLSPLRRSSRHHASTTAADKEREMREERKPKETVPVQSLRKRRNETSVSESSSGKKEKSERTRGRPKEKEMGKEKTKSKDPPKTREKEPVKISKRQSRKETQAQSEGVGKSEELRSVPRLSPQLISDQGPITRVVEIKVGTPHTEPSLTLPSILATSSPVIINTEALISDDRTNIFLQRNEGELTVKEVIAKRMRNGRMRGLSRDISRLINMEQKQANTARESLTGTVDGQTQHIVHQTATLRDVLPPLITATTSASAIPVISVSEARRAETAPFSSFILTTTPFDSSMMWSGICELPPDYPDADKFSEFNVGGERYIKMTSIIADDAFTVPVTVPISVKLPTADKSIVVSLSDVFRANEMPLKRRSLARYVYMVLRDGNLLVHKGFTDLMHDYSTAILNVPLEKEMEIPLEQLPVVPLLRVNDNIINAINVTRAKDYQYKPRIPMHRDFLLKARADSSPTTASISDPSYLANYIADIHERRGSEEADQSIGDLPDRLEASALKSDGSELRLVDRVLLIASYDANVTETALARVFGISVDLVLQIINQRAFNFRELTRRLIQSYDYTSAGSRRPTYVCVNLMMWRIFKDCRMKNLPINEEKLRTYAQSVAKNLGLEEFPASHNWYNAFIRRHRIDLERLTGEPARFIEKDGFIVCTVEPQCDVPEEGDIPTPPCLSPNHPIVPTTTAVTENLGPMDILQLKLEQRTRAASSDRSATETMGLASSPSTSAADIPSTSSDVTLNASPIVPAPPPQEGAHAPSGSVELELIQSIVKSASMHCPNKEVSAALNTLRSFVMQNNPSIMPSFLQFQETICGVAIKNEATASTSST